MRKFIFYFTTLVILIFLEILFSKFSLFGIFFIIFIGLYRGSSSGCSVGFFIGLIEGVFSASSFGVSSFSYSITGYLAGRLPRRIDEGNSLAQIMVVFFGVILTKVINVIIEMIFTGIQGSLYFDWTAIFILAVPLFFSVFRKWWKLWFIKLDVDM
jgi:rod shape-determining protein MreD